MRTATVVHAVRAVFVVCCSAGLIGATEPRSDSRQTSPRSAGPVVLPNGANSLKFAVLGDFGTGTREQYELAAEIDKFRRTFPFEVVILVGGNLYGSERPRDYLNKFERPYQPLLAADVKFFATLGNSDDRNQRYYKPFNMAGREFYSFQPSKHRVRFFAIDSVYVTPEQLRWIDEELGRSLEDWKIVFSYHPLYSASKRGRSTPELQQLLEPLFVKHHVSVVLNGRDHIYARLKPQKAISYFTVGSSGRLDRGGLDRQSSLTESGFDADQAFMVCEIDRDDMYFNVISRAGQIVDSGVVRRRPSHNRR